MSKPEFLELSQAVVRLGSSERTIRRRIEVGELVGKKVGRKWYVQISSSGAGTGVPAAQALSPMPMGFADNASLVAGNATMPMQAVSAQPAQPAQPIMPSTMPAQPAQPIVPTSMPAMPAPAEQHRATPPPQEAPQTPQQPRYNSGGQRGERRWARGHEGYTPASGDILDHAFAVGKLAAWRKVREMRACLKSAEDRADGATAAAALLEGFLGFGMQKIDCYRHCRGVLCRLVTRMEADDDFDEDHLMSASDALGAVHALVITLNRRNTKDSSRPAN